MDEVGLPQLGRYLIEGAISQQKEVVAVDECDEELFGEVGVGEGPHVLQIVVVNVVVGLAAGEDVLVGGEDVEHH